jgi:hypothetical protein
MLKNKILNIIMATVLVFTFSMPAYAAKYEKQRNRLNFNNGDIATKVYVSHCKIYFTYDDVMASLFAAAQVGPAAIVAALGLC